MLSLLASMSITAGVGLMNTVFGSTLYPKASGAAKQQQCSTIDPDTPLATPFVLPSLDSTCPAKPPAYTLMYFEPRGNPATELETPNSRDFRFVRTMHKPEFAAQATTFTYDYWQPNDSLLARDTFAGPNKNVKLFYDTRQAGVPASPTAAATARPLNFMPQTFDAVGQLPTATLGPPEKFEINPDTQEVIDNSVFWVVPGKKEFKSATYVKQTATDVARTSEMYGYQSEVYVIIRKTATLYLELCGARGGSVNVYSDGIGPDGEPILINTFRGGAPGVVYGLLRVNAGDVLYVHVGLVGTQVTGADIVTGVNKATAQGGKATVQAGANGGGMTYVYRFPAGPRGIYQSAIDAALSGAFQYADLVAVAGGGGGASKMASGGSAGHSDDTILYGSQPQLPLATTVGATTGSAAAAAATTAARRQPTPSAGSQGGIPYILEPAPFHPSPVPNGISGGGGVGTRGGQSQVNGQSAGKSAAPHISLQDNGGSVITETTSGGGGGGGGLTGGGAGGWNGLSKPNNVHGAGGGGSSSFGRLVKTTKGPYSACLNLYRPFKPVAPAVAAAGASAVNLVPNTDGYFIIGVPNA